ncbi:MAG: hypothetical protein IJF03_08690 [Lachnospiraceae bacterium]|nr:hypothetical protein [Lachnospiraceae bacterium]
MVIKGSGVGYYLIDLTKVKKVALRVSNGAAWVSFCDENGKQVDDSKKLKSMFLPEAKKLLTVVCENAD